MSSASDDEPLGLVLGLVVCGIAWVVNPGVWPLPLAFGLLWAMAPALSRAISLPQVQVAAAAVNPIDRRLRAGELQEYLPRFAARDYRRTGRIDNMVKDLNGAQDLARRTNTAMPLTAVCAEVHRMLTAAGLGGEDQAALMEFFTGAKREISP